MKKVILTAGIVTAMTPVLSGNVTYADSSSKMTEQYGVVQVQKNTNLNIRASYGTNYKVVGKIPSGKKVKVIEQVNGWYKVEYNGIKGYSSSKYIQLGQSSVSEESTKRLGKVVNLNSTRLNVRTGASTSHAVIGKLVEGDLVNIISKLDNGWYKVNTSKHEGYVYGKYVQDVNGSSLNNNASSNTSSNGTANNAPVVMQSSNVGKIASVTATSLNVRSGYSVNHSVVTRIAVGSNVKVLEVYSNGWGKVQLPSGISGYVNTKYLNNYREGSLVSAPQNNNTNINVDTSVNASVSEVLRIAKSKMGCRYEWGAEGPNSFDCSGFTYYSYKNGAGITLPRTSKAQATAGRAVSRGELKPGDLVFFNSSGNGISHVGLYIGNDEMIHSPNSGDVVKVTKITSNYYASRFVTARRIVG